MGCELVQGCCAAASLPGSNLRPSNRTCDALPIGSTVQPQSPNIVGFNVPLDALYRRSFQRRFYRPGDTTNSVMALKDNGKSTTSLSSLKGNVKITILSHSVYTYGRPYA